MSFVTKNAFVRVMSNQLAKKNLECFKFNSHKYAVCKKCLFENTGFSFLFGFVPYYTSFKWHVDVSYCDWNLEYMRKIWPISLGHNKHIAILWNWRSVKGNFISYLIKNLVSMHFTVILVKEIAKTYCKQCPR